MDVGVALPQMTAGLDRERVLGWCRSIDEGPFTSVSAGERITFDNLDGLTLCARLPRRRGCGGRLPPGGPHRVEAIRGAAAAARV